MKVRGWLCGTDAEGALSAGGRVDWSQPLPGQWVFTVESLKEMETMRRLYNVIMANRHTEEVREEFVFATSLDEAKMKMLIRQQVPEDKISWWVLSSFVVCEVPLMEDK
jgi:hypothetical protein